MMDEFVISDSRFCFFSPSPLVSWTGQFRVIGPGHPIRALVGDEAELPCRISPGKNATGMEVGWYRSPFSRVVHLYRNGKDQDAEQAPEYRGRTELLKESIGEGKVALRIQNVRFSDEGGYTCFFRDHSYQEEAAVELKVEGESSEAIRSMDCGVVDLPSSSNHPAEVRSFYPKTSLPRSIPRGQTQQ